jgi:hypothetical protein
MLEGYNRLISYARDRKGQFWLTEHPYEPDQLANNNNGFNARVRRQDEEQFVRWCPPGDLHMTVHLYGNERSISQADWKVIQNFFERSTSTEVVLEILSNAERLVESGHSRSAIP